MHPDGLANGGHIFQIAAVDAAGNIHEMAQTVFDVFVDQTLPESVVEPTPEENTNTTPPTEETTLAEDAPPAEGSSEVADAGATTDPSTPEVTPSTDENVDVVTSDPPAESIPDTTATSADVDVVDLPADTTSANSDGLEIEVRPETESTPVESNDTGAPEASDPAEPIRDLIYDRQAEQVGFSAAGAENTSGSDNASSTEEAEGTVFGCNLPLGNSNVVGGEYALLGVGLLGLGLRRPAGALRDMLWPDREATVTQDIDESG